MKYIYPMVFASMLAAAPLALLGLDGLIAVRCRSPKEVAP